MNQAKADFLYKLSAFFDNLPFKVNETNLCVCLSGGADSVSLLRGLLELSKKYNWNICACHFNHMIRGAEADKDEGFCKSLCDSLNVKLYCGRDNVPAYAKINKLSVEEAARDCRYAFFSRILSKSNIDYCVTAHNMNDDAETLLLNLIRGSGSNGASAIDAYNREYMRPMLKISRDEIEAYLTEIGQDYVSDSTNESVEYTRNYIRHVLIPDIRKINPAAVEAFSRYIDSCREDRDYFDNVVLSNLDADLRLLHKAVRTRVIIHKFKTVSGRSLNSSMITELDNALFVSRRNVLPLFNGYEAVIFNGRVDFYNSSNELIAEIEPKELSYGDNIIFGDRVKINISDANLETNQNFNKISIMTLLSFDKICGALRVRNRRSGDRIFIKGVNKSLKKLFIDKKVPKEYRDLIPIIFDDEGIIYVPFVGIADRAFPKNSINTRYVNTIFNTIDRERWSNAYEKQEHR